MLENYNGIPVESDSEVFIVDWLLELKSKGFIHSIERAPEILIAKGLSNKWVRKTQLKTKVKEEEVTQMFIGNHYYTPEFIVIWYPNTPTSIVWSIENLNKEPRPTYALIGHPFPIGDVTGLMTYIEVKPDQDFQNMTRAFQINKAWIWESRKMFINLMKPKYTFETTFTPQVYLHTRKKRTEREIKWKIRTVDQYLEILNPSRNDNNNRGEDTTTGISTEQLQSD